MDEDRSDAPARLAELLKAWDAMTRADRESHEGRVLIAEVRGFGQAAAYFAGWEGMQNLDRAVAQAGGPNGHLNELWDGIGVWCA